MPNFRFDEENHAYFIDDRKIPGYSEIAAAMGITDYSGVPGYNLELARKFGTAGHYALRLLDMGVLDFDTVSAPLVPCIKEYQNALSDYGIEIIGDYIERPVCSFRYRFGCTPDRICYVKRELSVIDFKFVETMQPAIEIQTAAQKIAAEEFFNLKIKRRYGLQIPMDGKCILHPYKDKADEQTWLCFLGAYNWRKRHGKL